MEFFALALIVALIGAWCGLYASRHDDTEGF